MKYVLLTLLIICFGTSQAQRYYLWDDRPAKDWMTEAYPIGNGRIGAMIFAGVNQEHIQFNENSLWTGDEQETGAYQAFGDLFVRFDSDINKPFTAYSRKLNLDKGLHEIAYQQDGQQINRRYFASQPDQVMVFDYANSKKGKLNAQIALRDAHGKVVQAEDAHLWFQGTLDNGMRYAAQVRVQVVGGSLSKTTDEKGQTVLTVKSADRLILLLSAATDYANTRATNWKSAEEPMQVNERYLQQAERYGVNKLLARHVADYTALFNRVTLDLDHSQLDAKQTTKALLEAYKKQPIPALEALVYQYGRYLLISSSRKGGLPANLQGLWNNSNNPPWRSDYHSNINVQMNYWPAEVANLGESAWPYLDYINSMREVKKINTQKEFPGVRGWTVKTENNIFGGESFLWNTPGSAWYAQALWEHYAFNKDEKYLREFAYPILKEISEFWDDRLVRRPDGTVVAPKGWSPEHGPTEDAVSYDHQIIYDLFNNYIQASTVLNMDADYRKHIAALRDALLKPKIGKWGQLQEWETDRDDPQDKHRHVSHLFGLYPGNQFSVLKTPELAKAARVTLTARGDESTGWSMAWKVAFWARLQDGNHAYKILTNFINLVGGDGIDYNNGGGVYANLLCAHPPFQIDGNLGYVAAVSEMLLQSQTDVLELLPALPHRWSAGTVKGLKARGNVHIEKMEWSNSSIRQLILSSPQDQTIQVLSPSPLAGLSPQQEINGKYLYKIQLKANKTVKFVNKS
ncbi:glycosyl hydrolase family 95 catalytic domain-containing protein [Sphingobacterium sp. UGAL515B_05]|uniref:glycoside hydrolase family 95 protein n=1 Tax=Sphingobacterium sp. UGAL515B_05 TaxID=2986767 RepID=UPI0029540371|nr:glycoside hydrolase N-terminal domain-containing protein [Sphingobacterium sp. UGAL515B_05]WON92292.1 glycoside hydrolase N-terminal domain-containing protein [Sphingobacterium sp. UGAL515B_05]